MNSTDQIILKPMMKIFEMVPYLKDKNIKFELINEECIVMLKK